MFCDENPAVAMSLQSGDGLEINANFDRAGDEAAAEGARREMRKSEPLAGRVAQLSNICNILNKIH
jgi:hypothetical protein